MMRVIIHDMSGGRAATEASGVQPINSPFRGQRERLLPSNERTVYVNCRRRQSPNETLLLPARAGNNG